MISFQEFEAQARARGFDEILERRWPPGTQTRPHAHPFAVEGLLVGGAMWLTSGSETRQLQPGDRFEVAADVSHAERYGSDGAVVWVARRR